jgi:hypothetical protein
VPMMRPSSLVLVALLLAAACSVLQADPVSSITSCNYRCWNKYLEELEDCFQKNSRPWLLTTPVVPAATLEHIREDCRVFVHTPKPYKPLSAIDACLGQCRWSTGSHKPWGR